MVGCFSLECRCVGTLWKILDHLVFYWISKFLGLGGTEGTMLGVGRRCQVPGPVASCFPCLSCLGLQEWAPPPVPPLPVNASELHCA